MSDATLREALLFELQRSGVLHAEPVIAAMRSVPRHQFVPSLSLEEAYADRAVAVKMRDDEIVSSISQPGMIVQMLQLLAPSPGDRVLEIGTGTGYNAALIAEMVGESGSVTTLELDEELARRAAAVLGELGYGNVSVLTGDGSSRLPDGAAYDRLVVSARSDDIAASWWSAAREGARTVIPLRLESAGEYAVGFVRERDRMRSIGMYPCAFIALRGQAAAAPASEIFYRDPSARQPVACLRRVSDVVAVRREDATPALLEGADVVIARPVTVFAVTF